MATAEKVLREKEFHNEWARSLRLADLRVRESFEACTAIENRYALKQMGDLRGKRILDLGCGAGESSVYFALKGAKVYACDVSDEFLKVAASLAGEFGVNIHPFQIDAGRLPFEDEAFDFVFGNGLLHHVEPVATCTEVRRVLRAGGKAVFIEPLPYNPAINVYRVMAKAVRTEDEKPLSFGELRKISPLFNRYEHREFWFFSLFIFFYFFLIKRWHPGKVRYWKKVIEEAHTFEGFFGVLQSLDAFFLKFVPILRPFCWNTVLTLTK